ncbi:MAG TPA: hypothetical protein VE991_10560, partial [Acidimicrobiales bacterium]|nr:hypothetical protein [Acidimicrobiales bacterium]
FRLGDHRRWVQWFADAVTDGGRAQRALMANVEQLRHSWRHTLESTGDRTIRSDAAVFAALELMPRHVVLTSNTLVSELGLSRKAALATLRRLTDLGILTAYGTARTGTSGQPASLYVSRELLGLAGSRPLR